MSINKERAGTHMSHMSNLVVMLDESGIPEEIYREASIEYAVRLLDDSVYLEKVNGKWKIPKGKEFENE